MPRAIKVLLSSVAVISDAVWTKPTLRDVSHGMITHAARWVQQIVVRESSVMANDNHPTKANGKICYIEIPAADIQRSAAFYQQVFGWKIRKRGDGATAFDDGVGQVSGTWVLGRKPTTEAGLLVYIMVDSVAKTMDTVVANGGTIVQPIGKDAPEITARFSDPAGNILGLYQEPA